MLGLASKLNLQIGVYRWGRSGGFGKLSGDDDHWKLRAACGLKHVKIAVALPVDDSMLAQPRSGVFHIRQIPGNKNALGLVKFVFPNGYNIYMHGTPETELFSKSRRDFSHGCICLAKPAELAAWVLRSQRGWTPSRIDGAMSGTTTVPVMLDQPIPILVV